MRIVICASYAPSLVNFRGPLVKEICDSGAEVHAICPDIHKDQITRKKLESWGVVVHDIKMHRTGINPIVDIITLISFFRLFRQIRPHVLFAYTVKPVVYGILAGRLARIPGRYALITGLGYAFTGDTQGKRGVIQFLIRALYRQALKRVETIFFQNGDDEALFRKLQLVDFSVPSKIVNGSGIDIAKFSVVPISSSAPRFLLIARLLGDKGVREFVLAAKQIRARNPEIVFRLVGDIDSNPDSISRLELDNWIKAGYIEYLGQLDDVRPAIEDSNVYVLPSYREGTPRTVLEAMAMGRAIITTDAPGCRETVVEGENGFLVKVKSVDALVTAMELFISEPRLIVDMGHRSREIAVEKYDVHKVNAVMLKTMGIQ